MESTSNTGSASTGILVGVSGGITLNCFCEQYVSEMRQKGQTTCWPFEFGSTRNDTTEPPMHKLPPLDVLNFRWWKCENCLLEPVTKFAGTVQSGTSCRHDISDSEIAELVTKFKYMSTVDMTEIRKHDDASMSTKAKENALIRSQVDDKDHGIENLLEVPEKDAGHQDLPSPDSIPTQVDGFSGQEQGMDAKVGGPSKQNDYLGPNKQHSGNREVSSIRHSTEDLQIQVKVSRSDQQMKLVRSCQASDTVENKQKPCEKLDGHGPPSCDSTEICSSSGDKSGRMKRRKVRKVRLMTDLLGEKGNLNAEPSRTRDSSLLLAVLDRSEEVGTIEDVKKGLHAQDRKRNLPSDEYFKMRKTVISNKEFEKVEIVRGKATNPKALVGSALDKDALVKLSSDSAMKTDGMKYRCADSNAIPNRKLKKKNNNQIIDQSFQIKESDLMQSKNVPMAGVGSFVENDASRRPIATTIVRCDKSKLGVDFAAAESKGETYGMPLIYEKQAYASQSKDETRSAMLQKDVQVVSTKGNICSQDQEAMKSKLYSEVADATVPAPVISDGIPMEIVELMAKIQHDNRLYDDANSKKKLNSSLHKLSKEQHNPKITKLCKQKMVSFSSQVTTNQMCTDPSAEKTHISKRRGAFRLYQEVCDSIPVRHRSSEAVGPWSSAMSMNSSPQERVKFLNFKSVNPEKKKHKKDLHLEPPRQNVSNLQNQFGPPADIYSNENIPAMHLLSLMEAGRKSGQSSCRNGAPSRLEKQQQTPLPHLYHSKESEGYPTPLAGMNLSVYDNAADRSNHATRDGNSSSCLLQRDESFRRDSVVPPTSLNQFKARDKGKGKLEGSTAKNLPRKSDTTLLNPMIFNTVGKKKLKSHNIIVDWTSKASPEPEICCTMNRNPADFSFPGPGNSYMIRGNEIKYFSRTTVRHCTQNSEHEIKIHLAAAALLAELQTVFPSSDITCWSSF